MIYEIIQSEWRTSVRALTQVLIAVVSPYSDPEEAHERAAGCLLLAPLPQAQITVRKVTEQVNEYTNPS
jgi:hypothetical protein